MLARGRGALAIVALALLWTLSGCAVGGAAVPEPATAEQAEERDPMALPDSMEALELSQPQRLAILAQRDRLVRAFSPLGDSGRAFMRSVATAARQCKGDSPFVAMAAGRVIGSGADFQQTLMDSVDELHGILTQEQREALVARLLDEDERRAPRDDEGKRKPRDNSQIEALGDRMDLSLVQMMKLLVRLTQVWDDFDDRVEPWRDHYREALRAFAREDFAVREMEVSRAPAMRLVMTSLRKGLRVSIPLLEPEQCQELADIITERANKPSKIEARAADDAATDDGAAADDGAAEDDGFTSPYDG